MSVFLCVLLLIPSRLVITQLGGAGSPQELMGLLMLGLWLLARLQGRAPGGRQPVKVMLAVVVVCFTISYVFALSRPIDAVEYSTANLGFVALLGWVGITLFIADLVPDEHALYVILRRLVFLGGILAVIAMVQFFTGASLVDKLTIPGLSANANQTLGAVGQRGGLNRPAATAIHPIEFGAIVTMILPIAITLALNDRSRAFVRRWFPAAALAFAVLMSVSRSALLSAGVGSLILWLSWPPARRRMAILLGLVFLVLVAFGVPGMLGTLLGLFTGISSDTSAASRTASYPVALSFIERSPFFGRGFATFLPDIHILDNAFLGLAIEVGLVGLAVVLVLLLTGVFTGLRTAKVARTGDSRSLGQALAASSAAGSVGLALYDGFGFPMGAAMIFLVLGLVACARRLAAENPRVPEQEPASAEGPSGDAVHAE